MNFIACIRRFFLSCFLVLSLFGFAAAPIHAFAASSEDTRIVDAYFFWGDGCPHCAKEEIFLSQLEDEYPTLAMHRFEIFYSRENAALLQNVGSLLKKDVTGVPFLVIGNESFAGYSEGSTDRLIEARIQDCTKSLCSDSVAAIVSPTNPANIPYSIDAEPTLEHSIVDSASSVRVPFFGDVYFSELSLPILSIVLGVLDGFNPCAMWVLVFLISMLIGMKNRSRMWALGGAFIVASAAVYFLFMSAWLELILFLGFISAIRAIIGLVALIGGGYSLREYFVNKEAVCKVGDAQGRKKTIDRIKEIVQERSFVIALVGIVALAFAVNLVELVCSAGFPAVFTQILSENDLPRWQYYGYIFLYIFFFMIDDLFVFFVSMITLQTTGLTTKYTRASRLIGGVLMLIIGLLLLFRPEWLMFG